jgi:hypothetical protein
MKTETDILTHASASPRLARVAGNITSTTRMNWHAHFLPIKLLPFFYGNGFSAAIIEAIETEDPSL